MIPSSALGVAFIVGCLAPGVLFVRVAEKRGAWFGRSGVFEITLLAAVGAITTVLASLIVLALADVIGIVDLEVFAAGPQNYVFAHPAGSLAAAVVIAALSCLFAWVAAWSQSRDPDPRYTIDRSLTVWQVVFDIDFEVNAKKKETKKRMPILTVEMKNGVRYRGQLASMTPEFVDNRELALMFPERWSPEKGEFLTFGGGPLIVMRESDVLTISVNYTDTAPPSGAGDLAEET